MVSGGAVMIGEMHWVSIERDLPAYTPFFGFYADITIEDLVMSDGKRLEGVGVMPDAPVVPSGEALNKGNDPVLAFAALLFGVELTPEQAGAFHFTTRVRESDM